ncbi:hypothetical protein [Clostridium tyrobutyricum]|uniref:hypothetical protein n=1 Tax=Clostridium tyrobutyricum TaxID=1519 RepID=UPI00073D612A|nr:hypothetical protein [Clostridium tyrobutyricum]
MDELNIDKSKLKYLGKNGYVVFDKQEIRKELELKNIYPDEYIENWMRKFKYYRLMSDGKKMFYSDEYIKNHTIEEIETAFQKIS